METESNPALAVPDDLLHHLHDATERLHHSKENREEACDAFEYRHNERVTEATEEFRKAETAVEEITEKIKESLHEQPAQ